MITPKLEELIHSGDAKTQNFCVGISGSCVLPVPEGKYIVIHNIVYFPFYNMSSGGGKEDFLEVSKLANKQVQFLSQKTNNHFVFRDSGLEVQMPVNIDTYLVHFDDVAISFLQMPSIRDPLQITFQATPITSVVRPRPLGYGNIDSVQEIGLAGVNLLQYIPSGKKNSLVSPNNSYREQYMVSAAPVTALYNPSTFDPDTQYIDRSMPMMNVQYVLINKRATDNVQSS